MRGRTAKYRGWPRLDGRGTVCREIIVRVARLDDNAESRRHRMHEGEKIRQGTYDQERPSEPTLRRSIREDWGLSSSQGNVGSVL